MSGRTMPIQQAKQQAQEAEHKAVDEDRWTSTDHDGIVGEEDGLPGAHHCEMSALLHKSS